MMMKKDKVNKREYTLVKIPRLAVAKTILLRKVNHCFGKRLRTMTTKMKIRASPPSNCIKKIGPKKSKHQQWS